MSELRESVERQQLDLLAVAGDLARVLEGFDSKDRSTWGQSLNDRVAVIDAAVIWVDFPSNEAVEAAARERHDRNREHAIRKGIIGLITWDEMVAKMNPEDEDELVYLRRAEAREDLLAARRAVEL